MIGIPNKRLFKQIFFQEKNCFVTLTLKYE